MVGISYSKPWLPAGWHSRNAGLLSKDKVARKEQVQGELRRQPVTVNLRAGMQLLLNRLHQVGEGARLRSKAHVLRKKEERVMGRTLLSKGHILVE